MQKLTWEQYEKATEGNRPDLALLWDYQEDSEHIDFTCIDDALLEAVEQSDGPIEPGQSLDLYGFSHTAPTLRDCGDPVAQVLKNLAEEHGDPREFAVATTAMAALGNRFLGEMLKLWKEAGLSWACELVVEVTIPDLYDWCREHAPEWLEAAE